MIDIFKLEKERLEWSKKTFPKANPISSLNKLIEEIEEVKEAIIDEVDREELKEEYADCLMCLFDSAGRKGITPYEMFKAFAIKLKKNKERTWELNDDNTYSHVKQNNKRDKLKPLISLEGWENLGGEP